MWNMSLARLLVRLFLRFRRLLALVAAAPRPLSLLSPQPTSGPGSPRADNWSAEEEKMISDAMLERKRLRDEGLSARGLQTEAFERISRLTGRTVNAIQNRWHSKVKAEFNARYCAVRGPSRSLICGLC